MTKKRFIKLTMSFLDRNTAVRIANKAIKKYDTYQNAFEYLRIYSSVTPFGYMNF
jgi:hypothetical protein